jgi:phosphocarrier protein
MGMVSAKVRIKNPTGLHLRPAGEFYDAAVRFGSKVMVEKVSENKLISANAKSVLSILGACIKSGDEITIICDGEDEEEALREMVRIVEDGLGE